MQKITRRTAIAAAALLPAMASGAVNAAGGDQELLALGAKFDAATNRLHDIECSNLSAAAKERAVEAACDLTCGLAEQICTIQARTMAGLLVKWRVAIDFCGTDLDQESEFLNERTADGLLVAIGELFAPQELAEWRRRQRAYGAKRDVIADS